MRHSRDAAFTIVELLIVMVVIGILVSITTIAWNGITLAARAKVAQSDLRNVSIAMQMAYQETGTYPATLPGTVKPSGNVDLTVKWSGTFTSYTNLTPVQNGVLLSQTCQALIDEGLGRAANQGGQMQTYITGCGNWNRGSMQVTAWNSRVWNTPVTSAQLLDYANTFTSSDTWNASQVPTVKNFYTHLVERHIAKGGTFPITTFWDSWATPTNGGVMTQALPSSMQTRTTYCVEAIVQGSTNIWHIGENGKAVDGACS